MANPRSFTDEQLREALPQATSWRHLRVLLGKSPGGPSDTIRRAASRLGLDASHHEGRIGGRSGAFDLPPPAAIDRRPLRNLADSAVTTCLSWFTEQGVPVSLPVAPTTYDVVADWGGRLHRVQVKSSTSFVRGRCQVRLQKSEYEPGGEGGAGHYRQAAYQSGEVDWFFVVTGDGANYLIPWSAVQGQKYVALPGLYSRYIIECPGPERRLPS